MDLQLAGRRCLITGGSKGIGFAAAEALAAEGCNLVLVARGQDRLDAARGDLAHRFSVDIAVASADLSRPEEVRRIADEFSTIDILVNNAGAIPPGSLGTMDEETWRRAWDLKVFGFIGLCRAYYTIFARRRAGVIVNMIGAAGESFDPGYIAGVTGNAALMAFTRAIGRASHIDNVRVVGINPGATATQRMELMLRSRAKDRFGTEERWLDLCSEMPFGRPAAPEEIASAVAFLASPRSGYTTGTILTINGGF